MKKTLITSMLAFFMLTAFIPAASAQNQMFSDLPEDHESYATIMNLNEQGIVEGYPDGTVRPDEYIKRAELMKIIVEGMGLNPHPIDYNRCFEDVQIVEEWYIGYVCFAKSEGWIVGYPDGDFGPDNNINNIEILSMLINSYELDMYNHLIEYGLFDDTNDDAWYYPYLSFAVEKDLVDYTPNNYYPGNLITRAKAFEMLEKIIGLTEPQTFTNENLSFTQPANYQRNVEEELFDGFMLFTNQADDGIAFVEESVFDDMMTDSGVTFEDMFVDMEGKNASLTVTKGQIVKVSEYNEYYDDYEGMFFFKVEPESGSGQSYYVVGHYLNDETRAEIIDMIETIEVK
jgi:hypothetical protein